MEMHGLRVALVRLNPACTHIGGPFGASMRRGPRVRKNKASRPACGVAMVWTRIGRRSRMDAGGGHLESRNFSRHAGTPLDPASPSLAGFLGPNDRRTLLGLHHP